MNDKIKIVIDGKECWTERGKSIIDVAKENGIYIPSLCHVEGVKPAGSCRICNVQINGRNMTACSTPAADGMSIESNIPELEGMRKAIVEVMLWQVIISVQHAKRVATASCRHLDTGTR